MCFLQMWIASQYIVNNAKLNRYTVHAYRACTCSRRVRRLACVDLFYYVDYCFRLTLGNIYKINSNVFKLRRCENRSQKYVFHLMQ